ncbi:MAG TPA: hypothetical protein VJZ76_16415, partial [Thermoanaerobaculia bacterium]|nr:hypothetical protein [Thermoanaerobaculia bacterium]
GEEGAAPRSPPRMCEFAQLSDFAAADGAIREVRFDAPFCLGVEVSVDVRHQLFGEVKVVAHGELRAQRCDATARFVGVHAVSIASCAAADRGPRGED